MEPWAFEVVELLYWGMLLSRDRRVRLSGTQDSLSVKKPEQVLCNVLNLVLNYTAVFAMVSVNTSLNCMLPQLSLSLSTSFFLYFLLFCSCDTYTSHHGSIYFSKSGRCGTFNYTMNQSFDRICGV